MTFQSNFCSSPWLHMRINAAGRYEFCRWADKTLRNSGLSINDVDPSDYFRTHMADYRKKLLDGQSLSECNQCLKMEQHGKVSGRQKQLLKIGVRLDKFEKTLASSPWISEFAKGQADGCTDVLPQDWQIDLGNHCNSACVFCTPHSSSRLAAELHKLKVIDSMPPKSWAEDSVLVEKFFATLQQTPHIRYMHFIGGETLITPSFGNILRKLIELDLNTSITIGFTTNLTVWNQEVVDLLCHFDSVHLGVSIECFHRVNDYLRWPSNLADVNSHLELWLDIARQQKWLVQLRTTPTVLSVRHLLTIYDWAWQNRIAVESCNFLDNPKFMRPSVLPLQYRPSIIADMKSWLADKTINSEQIINIRSPDHVEQQILQDLDSYVKYLENEPNHSHHMPDLVSYLKLLESSRGNSIIDYLPEYEELFRSAGY